MQICAALNVMVNLCWEPWTTMVKNNEGSKMNSGAWSWTTQRLFFNVVTFHQYIKKEKNINIFFQAGMSWIEKTGQ